MTSMKKTSTGTKTIKYTPDKTTSVSREEAMIGAVKNAEEADKDSVEWKKTTSNMLYNHLFECCNILRGPINQDEFKTYAIPILFF